MNAPTQAPSKEKVYPCGCSASPADEVPNYCPTHGRPVAEATYWRWFNSLTPSAKRFDLKLDAFCEGWAARGKLSTAPEPPAEPDQASMDRIFDSWFDSLPEPPRNYHQIFTAGYAAGLLRAAQPPAASHSAQVDDSGDAIAGTDVATAESVLAELDRLSETKEEVQCHNGPHCPFHSSSQGERNDA